VSVQRVEVLVEERSMAAALSILLPRLLGATSWEIHEHRGKTDLLNRLPARLKGYRDWLPSNARIVVLVDRDDDDCHKLKLKLERIASEAGFVTRSTRNANGFVVINRIAIEELESWYFGDWEAVRACYPRVPATIPSKAHYRDPDAIQGTWEAFERVLQESGYFQQGLAKINAARAIATKMVPERNKSRSFQALRQALEEIAEHDSRF
jgi:hypothetical protein